MISYDNCAIINKKIKKKPYRVGGIFRVGLVMPIQLSFFFGLMVSFWKLQNELTAAEVL